MSTIRRGSCNCQHVIPNLSDQPSWQSGGRLNPVRTPARSLEDNSEKDLSLRAS